MNLSVGWLKPLIVLGIGLYFLNAAYAQTCGVVGVQDTKLTLDFLNGGKLSCVFGHLASFNLPHENFGVQLVIGVVMTFWGIQSLVYRKFG